MKANIGVYEYTGKTQFTNESKNTIYNESTNVFTDMENAIYKLKQTCVYEQTRKKTI
jgi:hypothetical protein